jgi:hypothetical protein
MWGALSDKRTGLPSTIAAGPRQRPSAAGLVTIYSCLRVETPQPEGPGRRNYILQKQGGPVIPPGTGFPFRRLLLLAGLRWRYSNPPSPILANSTIDILEYLLHSNGCSKHKNKYH